MCKCVCASVHMYAQRLIILGKFCLGEFLFEQGLDEFSVGQVSS